jgi:hypothetical protein
MLVKRPSHCVSVLLEGLTAMIAANVCSLGKLTPHHQKEEKREKLLNRSLEYSKYQI